MGIPLIQWVVLLYEPLQFSRVVVQNRLVYSPQGGGELLLLLRHRLHSKHKARVTKGLGSALTGDTFEVGHQEAGVPGLGYPLELHWLERPTCSF